MKITNLANEKLIPYLQKYLFMLKSNQHIDKCFVPKKEV